MLWRMGCRGGQEGTGTGGGEAKEGRSEGQNSTKMASYNGDLEVARNRPTCNPDCRDFVQLFYFLIEFYNFNRFRGATLIFP